jgi:ectoine hydroxylase-related dioxygenase (phytanoyl-CoA dioxygenase family)
MSINTTPATAIDLPCISDEEAQFFLANGYLILRQVIAPAELAQLRAAADTLLAGGAGVNANPDFVYGTGHSSGQPVLRRIEYVIDKTEPNKVLLGHPFILRSVEKLMGPDLIPTWDSMVIKMAGEGIIVPWHRDAGLEEAGDQPIFNVDFYLDAAELDTCLWVYPGSHLWPQDQVDRIIQAPGFSTEGAIPVPMQPGDVILHNIHVLHGSPASSGGKLRRVVYYEFRTAHVEAELGPHTPQYIPLKQQLLLAAIARRTQAPYIAANEVPFHYDPPEPWAVASQAPSAAPTTWRYAHENYWRKSDPQWFS